jgi:hypothetical protein
MSTHESSRQLGIAAIFMLAWPGLGDALERRLVPMGADPRDEWASGATCTVQYYNTCTGWIWVWAVAGDGRFGVVTSGCCDDRPTSTLMQTSIYYFTGSPPGRGFTGTIDVYAADANGCPVGPAIASQPHLPPFNWGFQLMHHFWGGLEVPNPFVVAVRRDASYGGYVSDFPGQGPTGPLACGICYPVDRPTHSFYWGTQEEPLCPGREFDNAGDSADCYAELMWYSTFACPISVEESTWGRIKTLHR